MSTDGELVLYSAGGHPILPTCGKKAQHSKFQDTLESTAIRFLLSGMDMNPFEQEMESLLKKIVNNTASVVVPADQNQ